MLPPKLKRHLTSEQDLALREPTPLHAKEADFDPENLVESSRGDAQGFKEDGSLLFWVVKDVFSPGECLRAYEHLRTVNGDPTSRGEVTGGGHGKRDWIDGVESNITDATPEKKEEYKRKGAKANILGYMNRTGRFPYCRQTAWTAANPEILENCWPMINRADAEFKRLVPDRYKFQEDHIDEHLDFTLGATAFTTVTVNKKLSTTYHRDDGDLKGGFGVMFNLGGFTRGQLVFPAFRVAVDYQPGSMILADVHETHGNLDNIEGERITCVLYAREKINVCGTAEEEEERAAGMSIHGRDD
jgi:hypothetical protein